MEKIYFDSIDRIISLKLDSRVKYMLTFLYFPVLIFSFLFLRILFDGNLGLSSLFILPHILAAPMLMIPSWYFLSGKNFFVLRNFSKLLDSKFFEQISLNCQEQLKNVVLFKNENRESSNLFIYSHKRKVLEDEYKPNKKIGKISTENLRGFYEKKANEYFDVIEYDFDYLLNILKHKKVIRNTDKIKLNEELSNAEIAELITGIKAITGIYENSIQLLFQRFDKSKNSYKNLNWNSIKSVKSQCNRPDKS